MEGESCLPSAPMTTAFVCGRPSCLGSHRDPLAPSACTRSPNPIGVALRLLLGGCKPCSHGPYAPGETRGKDPATNPCTAIIVVSRCSRCDLGGRGEWNLGHSGAGCWQERLPARGHPLASPAVGTGGQYGQFQPRRGGERGTWHRGLVRGVWVLGSTKESHWDG